ncbi:MAG: hypothetical protein DA328_07950 [Nitrososphaeraceae archaeon]|nr:hypothetical protein [Nitrososphaeraceae archaeon]
MKLNFLKVPNVKLNDNTKLLVIGGLAAAGIWYFGINPSTRKFDLLGMFNMNKQASPLPNIADAPDMEPITVTNDKPMSNIRMPTAFRAQYFNDEVSDLRYNSVTGAY